MQPGDYIQYRKYKGKIIRAYENNIYSVELYNYKGFAKMYRHCSGKELFEIEKAAI